MHHVVDRIWFDTVLDTLRLTLTDFRVLTAKALTSAREFVYRCVYFMEQDSVKCLPYFCLISSCLAIISVLLQMNKMHSFSTHAHTHTHKKNAQFLRRARRSNRFALESFNDVQLDIGIQPFVTRSVSEKWTVCVCVCVWMYEDSNILTWTFHNVQQF